jgi:hypothetical protein
MGGNPKPRRTRGPRTPHERAYDAARTAATLFEKLPPDHFADTTLKPIAAFLRFISSRYSDVFPEGEYVSLRELQMVEKAERMFLETVEEWRWAIDVAPFEKGLRIEALLETQRRELRELKERIAALSSGDDG